ncbi:MAG: alpha/beta hydrolase [Mangrovicoccus sp.]|nr:alpha/beta hydrolase [Mangrovicoccus sp.]
MDLNQAYNIMDYTPGGAAYPARWAQAGADHRALEQAMGRAYLNLAYGPGARQKLDLFYPAGRPEGLVFFIHGGYWRRFDRSDFSHFAAGAAARGWAVAMPSYTLAPEAWISQMSQEMGQALALAAARVPGPLRLCGYSAGGHLVARLSQEGGPLPQDLAPRIARSLIISPLGDLRPLLGLEMNEIWQLDAAEAAAESPALHQPRPDLPISIWVGAEERPVFLDQARGLATAWGAPLTIAPELHHFNILDGLSKPGSPLLQDLLAV